MKITKKLLKEIIEQEINASPRLDLLQIVGPPTKSKTFRGELYSLVEEMDKNPVTKVHADKLNKIFKKYFGIALR